MNSSSEQTIETIHAMRQQEERGYSVVDYLSHLSKTTAALDTPVDASCRHVMAKWCNEIADFCDYKKETVEIAMNCLDRFMATPSGQEILLDRNLYQLAAMTALYSSVKIHEQEAMDPNLVSNLSRGAHSPQAVEAMESKMLAAIQWRVNPPTTMSFVRSMIELVPDELLLSSEKDGIFDVTQFQTQMIVTNYDFCKFDASSIAFACVLNAIESVVDNDISCTNFETTMAKYLLVDNACVRDLRMAIYELLDNSTDAIGLRIRNNSIPVKIASPCAGSVETQANGIHSSPRTVTVGHR